MSCYIKRGIAQLTLSPAFYIGSSGNPHTRGLPKNKNIESWERAYGSISWSNIMIIPEHEVHAEFGESFLINCFKEKFPNLNLLNVLVPDAKALVYDKKAKVILDKLKKLI